MSVKKSFCVMMSAVLLMLGVLAAPVQADVAILDNLTAQGVESAALTSAQLDQERATNAYYLTLSATGGKYQFNQKVGSFTVVADTKPEYTATLRTSDTSGGVQDRYYNGTSSRLLFSYNRSTGARDASATMTEAFHYSGLSSFGGITYVRSYGSYYYLPRTNGSTRVIDLPAI